MRELLTNETADQWIWWFAPAVGAAVMGMVYWIVPPYHSRAVRMTDEDNRKDDHR